MKKVICFLLLIGFLSSLAPRAFAEDLYARSNDTASLFAVEDSLPEEQKELTGSLRLDGQYDVEGACKRLINKGIEAVRNRIRTELSFGARLLCFALICSLSLSLSEEKKINTLLEVCACCAVSLILTGEVNSVMTEAASTIYSLSDFSKASLSAVFLAAAASGAPASAPVRYAAASLTMDIMMSAAERLVLPLIQAFTALSVSRSLFDNSILSSTAKAVKWCALTSMTVLTLVFGFYISATGLIAGSTDAIAVKTTKAVLTNVLPVVGGILSDSAAVVLSAAAVIKNSVGVFSLIAVCSICIGPFAFLGVKMLLLKAVAAAADLFPGFRLSALIRDFGTALGMLLGLVGCCGIMLFLSICSGIRTVTP